MSRYGIGGGRQVTAVVLREINSSRNGPLDNTHSMAFSRVWMYRQDRSLAIERATTQQNGGVVGIVIGTVEGSDRPFVDLSRDSKETYRAQLIQGKIMQIVRPKRALHPVRG